MLSIVIGISLQSIIRYDRNILKWIQRYNLDNMIIVFITLYYNNIILILGLIGFIICGVNSNKILLMHWTLIIINTIYFNNNINNNLINIIFIVLVIDIISVIKNHHLKLTKIKYSLFST